MVHVICCAARHAGALALASLAAAAVDAAVECEPYGASWKVCVSCLDATDSAAWIQMFQFPCKRSITPHGAVSKQSIIMLP